MSTTFDDHDPFANSIYEVLKSFIGEIGNRGCVAHFNKVVQDKYFLKGKHLIQTPERFIEEHLVFPMLEKALRHDLRPRPKQYAPRWPGGNVPDFCLTTIPIETGKDAGLRMFGEVKQPKKMHWARKDMRDYLNKDIDFNAVTILTDGFEWELWVRPQGEQTDEGDTPYAKASLRDPLKAIAARNMEVDTATAYNVRDRIDSDAFSPFTAPSIRRILREELDATRLI